MSVIHEARRREVVEVRLSSGLAEGALDARVRAPSGRALRQPAFWSQPHERGRDVARERWTPAGEAGCFLRLALEELGRHEVEIVRGEGVVDAFAIEVAPSDRPGAVRLRDGRLVRDDGSRVTPIGMNLCWWLGPDPSFEMDRVLARMAEAGMTWTRLWITHFGAGFTPEWDAAHPSGDYAGLGHDSQVALARLDRFFATAERLGIDVQLVLWQHSQLASPSHSAWGDNPYNAARGGPCATSADFFTHPEAVRLSDRRLRTLVARYGASPALFAWEVYNEMDLVMDAPVDVVAAWCAARARTLRELDGHGHLLTTSQAFPPSLVPPIASVDATWDLGQVHVYAEDLADALAREAAALVRLGKPALASEVGLGPGGEIDRAHRDGRHLAEATWAALASGLAGGAMSWWWDSAIDARDWYRWQTGAARFVREVDVTTLGAPADAWHMDGAKVMGRAGPTGAMAYVRGAGGTLRCRDPRLTGEFRVEQWSPDTGEAVSSEVQTLAGALDLALRPYESHTAVTVRRCGPG